ncbi:hypothetical protein COCOBI_03-1750 [Coccomyxa sp. Obi]|nr:hypothetical protein COCOBI_03-1750 [Coccomyxa sp. Obi]
MVALAFQVQGQDLLNLTTAVQTVTGEAIYLPKPLPVQCAARFQSTKPISVIMVADDGTFSGTSEAVFILGFLQNKLQAPAETNPCQQFYTGTLLGQSVVVAISGIGPEASALCSAFVAECASNVKDFIYVGTSGYSSQVGGALNAPGSCGPHGVTTQTRLGDIAVTPYSVNWQCKLASWTEQCTGFPNICTYPTEEAGPLVRSLYGQCIFSTKTAASTALADELLAAAKTPLFAANALKLQADFNKTLLDYETTYWNLTSVGTGVTYPPLPAWTGPRILDYTQAAEIDGQFFFSGTPWDMVARNYTALTLNLANNSTLTQYDVTAVNAEEGIGVSAALDQHNSLKGVPKISYTFVRGASDYLYAPPLQVSPGNWIDNPAAPVANFDTQYRFAIQTTSTLILTFFQLRCQAAGNSAATCGYTLPELP